MNAEAVEYEWWEITDIVEEWGMPRDYYEGIDIGGHVLDVEELDANE